MSEIRDDNLRLILSSKEGQYINERLGQTRRAAVFVAVILGLSILLILGSAYLPRLLVIFNVEYNIWEAGSKYKGWITLVGFIGFIGMITTAVLLPFKLFDLILCIRMRSEHIAFLKSYNRGPND